jgi:hypothetical protein
VRRRHGSTSTSCFAWPKGQRSVNSGQRPACRATWQGLHLGNPRRFSMYGAPAAPHRERSCDCGVATLASPTFRSHQPSAWRVLANAEGDFALHKSLDAPRCWRKPAAATNIQSSWRPGGAVMRPSRRTTVAAATALALWLGSHSALAQKSGGILKMPDFASPASMSIHEEVTPPRSPC